MMPTLSLVTFLPFVGALVLWLLPMSPRGHRITALIASLVTFLVSLPLWFNFDRSLHTFQFEEKASWIPAFGISYHLGVDGISVLLVLLSTFLGVIAVLCSFSAVTVKTRSYYAFLLTLQTGMTGVFVGLDLFLFYVFWEAMLIPMYFLIGVWGGERRLYAAIKFFIYTMFGSLLMLVALVFLAIDHARFLREAAGALGQPLTQYLTFDLATLLQSPGEFLSRTEQFWMFGAFGLAFAIKVPLFPFHTWLPDAHVEAPTAGSVILAGVLLKMGTYGYVRFCLPLFPEATVAAVPVIAILSIIGIIYGAMVAMVQPDLKKLVAYSSVSHLGFVMLGIFSLNVQGLQGGMLQMLNHGISTGALFFLVGVIYERRHTRLIDQFGGLTRVMPAFAVVFMIITLSSIGLPGTNGFVGEFLILLGAFGAGKVYGVLAATGVVLAAVYMLWMFQRVMFGIVKHDENKTLRDLNAREWVISLSLLAFVFWIGFYPKPFLETMEASVNHVISQVGAAPPAAPEGEHGVLPGAGPDDAGAAVAAAKEAES